MNVQKIFESDSIANYTPVGVIAGRLIVSGLVKKGQRLMPVPGYIEPPTVSTRSRAGANA